MVNQSEQKSQSEQTESNFLSNLSDDQIQAVHDVVEAVHSAKTEGAKAFFLYGKAGTGKSYVCRTIIDILGRHCVSVTASTGLAAFNIGGGTVHSMAGMRPPENAVNTNRLQQNLAGKSLLVVDEVSMLSAEIFEDLVQGVLEVAPNMVILFVGDMFQLPPVTGSPVYTSDMWRDSVTPIQLTVNHRQDGDKEFDSALDKIRNGVLDDSIIRMLSTRIFKECPDDVPLLDSRRNNVDAVNNAKLEKLGTPITTWEASVQVCPPFLAHKPEEQKAYAEKMSRVPWTCRMAVGARVMFLNNDKQGRWVNGSLGWVRSLNPGLGTLGVQLDGRDSVITVIREANEVKDSNGNTTFSYYQFPLDLAWAVTIHKSQGQTLERVCVSMSNHFAEGMTYVALSRCKSLAGLYLLGRVPSKIKTNKTVVELYG